MKTKNKSDKNKLIKLFNKYDKNKSGLLSESQMNKLILKEYKEKHNKNVMLSLMHIWGVKYNNKYYISKESFIKLYISDEGFFRDKTI